MRRSVVKFGLVGAGAIARSYVQAFHACEEAQLIAMADVRPGAVRALVERCDCHGYESHLAMAEAEPLDAVIVCTPPVSHPEICLDFLRRRVHVLCEKPLSIESESARRMIDAAKEFGVHLSMASKFRHVEDIARAKNIVSSGILGEIVLFENAFTTRVDMSTRWNSNPLISGGGVLIDNGTHSVDLMRYFLGPLAEVQVIEGKRVQGLLVEDTVRIFVRSMSGVVGNIDLSWSIDKELDSYIKIYGSQGTVAVGWRESKYRQSSSCEWVVFGHGYDKIQALRRQIVNFARAIRGEENLVVTPEDALASVEVMEAAYAALRRDQWIRVSRIAELSAPNNDLSPESALL
jgi:predicted dehydrogenase